MNYLGQHFLKSKRIVDVIVNAAEITQEDTILEIGPGRGILTEALLKKAGKVIAVEKDKNLVRYLSDKFKNAENLELIDGDILKIKIRQLTDKNQNYKIVANIPYYITSHFLRQFLTTEKQPKSIVLMIQKEVAKRIVSQPPEMSMLSVSVQAYAEPKIVTFVSKRLFSPPPKVDSAIIKLQNISRDFFTLPPLKLRGASKIDEKEFFTFVKQGFSHKRKTLKNNFGMVTAWRRGTSPGIARFKRCKISPQMRAQELSLKDWKCLCQILSI